MICYIISADYNISEGSPTSIVLSFDSYSLGNLVIGLNRIVLYPCSKDFRYEKDFPDAIVSIQDERYFVVAQDATICYNPVKSNSVLDALNDKEPGESCILKESYIDVKRDSAVELITVRSF